MFGTKKRRVVTPIKEQVCKILFCFYRKYESIIIGAKYPSSRACG